MDPGRRYLYVSNANADLRYGGGTVQLVDMLAFECTMALARQQLLGDARPLAGACGDPGNWTASLQAARCTIDPLDPALIDCDETPFIVQTATVTVGNFAGGIKVQKTGPRSRRLFVAVRGDPSITVVDVDLVDDPVLAAPGVVMSCYDHPGELAKTTGYDAATHTIRRPEPCDSDFLVQKYICQGLPDCQVGLNPKRPGETQLPTEPFGMQIDATGTRLLVAHQETGQVSVIDIAAARPQLLSASLPFFSPDQYGRHGAFALARQPQTDLWYLTSNLQPQIATFQLTESSLVLEQATFLISSTFNNGSDLRDIAFDPSGQRAFITENNPPSVLVLDTSASPAHGGLPINRAAGVVNVCQTPSHMGVRHLSVAGAPGTPSRTATKLIIPCFSSNQVMIVDPDRMGVDDTIFSGFGGPNDIAFNFADVDDPHGDDDLDPVLKMGAPPPHAYVTNFSESTIAVVDLMSGSPTQNQVVARLGFPLTGYNP